MFENHDSYKGRKCSVPVVAMTGVKGLLQTVRQSLVTSDENILSTRNMSQKEASERLQEAWVRDYGKRMLTDYRRMLRERKRSQLLPSPVNADERNSITWDSTTYEAQREIKDTVVNYTNSFWFQNKLMLKDLPGFFVFKNYIVDDQDNIYRFNDDNHVILKGKEYPKRDISAKILYPLLELRIENGILNRDIIDNINIEDFMGRFCDIDYYELRAVLRGDKLAFKYNDCWYRLECDQQFGPAFVSDMRWLFITDNKNRRKYYSEEASLIRAWFDIKTTDEIIIKKIKMPLRSCFNYLVVDYWNKDMNEWFWMQDNMSKVCKKKNLSVKGYIQYFLFGMSHELCHEYLIEKLLKRIKRRRVRI